MKPTDGATASQARAAAMATGRVPEVRFRGKRWLSFTGEEAITLVLDALGRGEEGLDQIRVFLEGTHRAPLPDFSEKQGSIKPPPGSRIVLGQQIELHARRSGLFERFPSVFFCDAAAYINTRGDPAAVQIVDESEQEARLYLQPFDRESMFVRARNRFWTSVIAGACPDELYRDFVWRLFGLPLASRTLIRRMLPDREQTVLTFLLPHLGQIAGDLRRVQQVLRLFISYPLRVVPGSSLAYELPSLAVLALDGHGQTGQRAAGQRILRSEKVVVLDVGPIPSEEMTEFESPSYVSTATGPLFELTAPLSDAVAAQWGSRAWLLRFLCGLLMPVDLRVMLQPRARAIGWRLEEGGRCGRVGIDTLVSSQGRSRHDP